MFQEYFFLFQQYSKYDFLCEIYDTLKSVRTTDKGEKGVLRTVSRTGEMNEIGVKKDKKDEIIHRKGKGAFQCFPWRPHLHPPFYF